MKDEELSALRAQHGNRTAEATIDGQVIVFKTPTLADWETFTEKLTNGKSGKAPAMRELCYSCLVHPARQELMNMFERLPALPARLADVIGALAGGEIEVVLKKG